MKSLMITGILVALATGAQAESDALDIDCAAQAELVMEVVTGRTEGVRKRKARRTLREGLGKTAGDALAEWVYSLPEEQLTDEVGAAWKAQCETL